MAGMRMPAGRAGFRPAAAAFAANVKTKWTGVQKIVILLWFFILFEPQYLAAEFGLSPLLKAPLALMALLAMVLVTKQMKGDWIWALFAWIVATAANFPFAVDRGLSMNVFKALIVYYIFGLGLVRAIRTPKTASTVLFMLCVLQYIWWAVNGIKNGGVPWHSNLSNPDGFGPLMAMGVGPAYFYAMATKNPTEKKLALLAAGLCVVGVVSAFARGAVVGLVASIGWIWLRSPNKVKTSMMMVVAGVIVIIVGSMIDGNTRDTSSKSNFFEEMASMFDSRDGTANDRKALWDVATREFLEHPVMGVGAEQFGAYAARHYPAGTVGGQYEEAPGTLYGRALHSNYYQILSEYGLIGVVIFVTLCVSFFRSIRYLTLPKAQAAWEAGGGTTDVGKIAIGIECAMMSFLLTGYFYNQIFVSWFYCLILAAIVMRQIAQSPVTVVPRRPNFVRRPGAPMPTRA
jgi:O-antigen ligase